MYFPPFYPECAVSALAFIIIQRSVVFSLMLLKKIYPEVCFVVYNDVHTLLRYEPVTIDVFTILKSNKLVSLPANISFLAAFSREFICDRRSRLHKKVKCPWIWTTKKKNVGTNYGGLVQPPPSRRFAMSWSKYIITKSVRYYQHCCQYSSKHELSDERQH